MIISIYTQINPRLEVFFLEEWISHHLMLGVDKVYIYNNGFVCQSKHEKSLIWSKKPYANYFFEYSDDEIKTKLRDIVESFGDQVSLVDWRTGKECPGPTRPRCQVRGYKHCATNNQSDWWIHIDPDEYILSKRYHDIRQFISAHDLSRHSMFVMGQKLFDSRTIESPVRSTIRCQAKPRPMKNWGMTKAIIRATDIKSFNIHRPLLKLGRHPTFVNYQDLMYYHYRGLYGGGHSLEEFNKKKSRGLRSTDDSMIKFVEKHGVAT
jgi:hypothetical protein